MNVTRIHQLELTSECNLRCKYCVHPHMARTKQHMSWDVFNEAIKKVKHCVDFFGQAEVNLAGIGESTMHPDFAEMVIKTREKVGKHVRIAIATNGVSLTENQVKEIAPSFPMIWVSMHRPEKAGPAIELLKKYGLLAGVSADPSVASMNWAGKVKWHVSCKPDIQCPWLTLGMVVCFSTGEVGTCCLDGDGEGIVGNIFEPMSKWDIKPYSLCDNCHHTLPRGL